MILLESGYIEPRSSLGVAPDIYKVTESDEEIVFMTPTPGLSERNVTVKVINNKTLVIKSTTSAVFTPRFRFKFAMPEGFLKEDIVANIEDGILYVRLVKNK